MGKFRRGIRGDVVNLPEESLDLELEVAENVDQTPEVRILASPFDRPRAQYQYPFPEEELNDLLLALEGAVTRDAWRADGGRYTGTAPPLSQTPKEIGSQLMAKLFPEPLLATFRKTLEMREERRGMLRIRLCFGTSASKLVPSSALPWELVHDPEGRCFLVHQPEIAFVRYIDVAKPIRTFQVSDNLRVLVIAAEPTDLGKSTVQREEEWILKALEKTQGVTGRSLEKPTWEALQAALSEEEIHVVHFLGHSNFNYESGDGGVFFEAEGGTSHLVYSDEFAGVLGKFPSLRLVIFSSCRGAAIRRKAYHDEFGGVAVALVAAGVPAVVAMQYSISNTAAVRFCESFYGHLLESGHVDEAVTAMRRGLLEQDANSMEWLSPVLVSRAANGRIFHPKSAIRPEGPHRIGIRSILGWGLQPEDHTDAFLSLTAYFRETRYAEPEVWQTEVLPRVQQFVQKEAFPHKEVDLFLATHTSLTFAIGYLLGGKAGIKLGLEQRSIEETRILRTSDPKDPDAGGWEVHDFAASPGGKDIAIALSTSRPTRRAVQQYVGRELPQIGRILEFRPEDGVSLLSVINGRHAFRLAEKVSEVMQDHTALNDPPVFHLFLSAPNILALLLGQVSRPHKELQLYEFDFLNERDGGYSPSLRLTSAGNEGTTG